MKGTSKGKKKKSTTVTSFHYSLIPVILTVAVLPLITYLVLVPTNLAQYSWYDTRTEIGDLFLYRKMQFFLVVSAVALLIVGFHLFQQKKHIKFTKAFLPLFIYGLLTLLSAVFSDFSSYSFQGILDQFESVWVLLGYCVIAYYAFMVINDSKDVTVVLWCILISCVILSVIGISQFFGHDFFATSFGRSLIIPEQYASMRKDIQFGFANQVYATLYNPNYVGSYAALLVPIFLMLLFAKKKWYWLLSFGVGFVLLMITYIGSRSKTGFIALSVSLVFFLVIEHRLLRKHWKIAIGVTALVILLFTLGSMKIGVNYVSYVKNALKITKVVHPLEDFQVEEEYVKISYKKHQLYITASRKEGEQEQFVLRDEEDQEISTSVNKKMGTLTVKDGRFPFQIGAYTMNDMFLYGITIDKQIWYFTDQLEDGKFHYVSPTFKITDLQSAEQKLIGYDRWGSGRGFIWGMTLPLFKYYGVLGSGPDTFTLAFPNYDFVATTNGGYRNIVISRPHNLYLQIGIQTGLPSLAAFLIFYLIYFISSIRLYYKIQPDDLLTCTGVGIFLGTIGYMVTGIANDSTICVAPLFWVLMGMGMAVNRMVSHMSDT